MELKNKTTSGGASPNTVDGKKTGDKRKLQKESINKDNVGGDVTTTTTTTTTIAPNISAAKHRHSISYINNNTATASGANTSVNGNVIPRLERRTSSFASPSSSYARRRSFLSPSMISNEKHTVYELHSGMGGYNSPSFSISLKESQGFSWNQDLFASQYQQQSSAVYDTEESDDDVESDDEEAQNGAPRYHSGSRSLSMSNENGYKVRVIDIKVDEDENIFQVEP